METTSLFLWASFVATIGYFLLKVWQKQRQLWSSQGVTTLEMPGLFETLTKHKFSFLPLDDKLYKQCTGAFAGYFEFFKPVLFVRDLELAKTIFVKDFDYFVNRRTIKTKDNLLNGMLITKCDREWKDLRATMSPTFSTGKIRRMFPIMNDSSKKLILYLKELTLKNEGMVDFEDVLGRYAMDVISSAAFGIESQVFREKNSFVSKMAKRLQFKFTPWFTLKFAVLLISESLARFCNITLVDEEAGNFFHKIIMDSMRQREISAEKRNDFLQLMIETKNGQLQAETEEMDTYEKDAQLSQDSNWKKSAAVISDDLIVSNCILFILGGFDTTQSALDFGAYALALNPEVQETLRRELHDATEHTGGELTYDIVNQAEYLDKVVSEILRMYPPALRTERVCSKEYILPNKAVVPNGTLVAIPMYQIHHDEKHFPNPELFDPERFSPEAKAARHPYAYMPFGHGPRNCIANRFALTETKTAIANLVMHFELEPCAKTTIPMVFAKTSNLKPSNGMWLNFKPIVK